MIVDERVMKTLERAMDKLKQPESDQDLFMTLRLISSLTKHESRKVLAKSIEEIKCTNQST